MSDNAHSLSKRTYPMPTAIAISKHCASSANRLSVMAFNASSGSGMHGYQWQDSTNPNYTIEGLNADNHGPYCRDALTALLRACPAISGVTLGIHGESGVAEGSYAFWGAVFDGVKRCGRKVGIELHANGID